jgi:hypothetical protein
MFSGRRAFEIHWTRTVHCEGIIGNIVGFLSDMISCHLGGIEGKSDSVEIRRDRTIHVEPARISKAIASIWYHDNPNGAPPQPNEI